MKKKRKYNKKILITLSMLFTMICSVFALCKTYAYQSYNPISDTLNLTTITQGQYLSSLSIEEGTSPDNENYKYIEMLHSNSSSNYMSFGITLNSDLSYINTTGNYIALCNLEYGYYSNNEWTTYTNSNQYITFNMGNISTDTSYQQQIRTYYFSYHNVYGYAYKTAVKQIYSTNQSIDFTQMLYFNFRLPVSTNNVNYGFRIYNIDIISTEQIYTEKYIEEYYGPLEEQYNQLLQDYETLESNYDTLNDNYTELEENYNQLETNYNDLQVDYDNLDNQLDEITSLDTNGMWAYFSAITISALDDNNNNVFLYTYNTFEDFKQSNFISGINIDLSSLKTDYPNYTKFNIFLLTPNSGSQLLLNNLYFRFLYNNTTNVAIGISNTMTFQIQLTNTLLQENEYKVNYDVITNNVGYFNENENITVLAINFEFDNNDNFVIQSTNNEYTNGFINGYTKGYNSRQNTINALQTDISNLNNQINTLQQEISILNGQVETLSNDEYSLNNLMWTIGATPFESFKHIWNVNFLGVNIAEFILGIITTFIGLYILKKFFF